MLEIRIKLIRGTTQYFEDDSDIPSCILVLQSKLKPSAEMIAQYPRRLLEGTSLSI